MFPLFFAACNVINDDLSVCKEDLVINYQLQLHTELSMQLQTELVTETELPVRQALENWLKPIFTDKAKDIDLRFYSEETDNVEHRIHKIINDNRSRETISLPKQNYMHLAVANIEENSILHLSDGEHSATMQLGMPEEKQLNSLNTGVFTARLPMEVSDTTQEFHVHLYMITSAVALVIDTTDCPDVVSVNGSMLGSACAFSVRDSVFSYARKPELRMENIPVSTAASPARGAKAFTPSHICLGTVGLATEGATEDDDKEWIINFTTTLTNNRHTTTTLSINKPLLAGTLRIIKVKMQPQGGLNPADGQEVGATVALDWKDGGEHDVELF